MNATITPANKPAPNASTKSAAQQFSSRKFIVTLGALGAALQTGHLDLATKVIIAVVACVYIVAETTLDKGGQARILEVARAAMNGVASSPASSAASAILNTIASDLALSAEAKTILKQAYEVVSSAAAASQAPPPPTTPSPTMQPPAVVHIDPEVLAKAIVDAFGTMKAAAATDTTKT